MRAGTGGGGLRCAALFAVQGGVPPPRPHRQDGEAIEVLALPLQHAHAFLMDTSLPKSAGMMFGVGQLLLKRT